MMLKDKNKLLRDDDITMDVPAHIYTIKGEEYKGSVSTFLKEFFDKFNMKDAILAILKSKKINDPSYEYYGMNEKDIINHWDSGRNLGTELHAYIEDYFNNIGELHNITKTENLKINKIIEYRYFYNFLIDHSNLTPYRSELMIYHEKLKLVGSVDMLYIKPNGHMICMDWKRSKRIDTTSFGNKCSKFPGIEHIPDCNYYHYSFQLNIYKFILETEYNMIIDEMYMVVFHPNNSNYLKYPIINMSYEMNIIMRDRWNKIYNSVK